MNQFDKKIINLQMSFSSIFFNLSMRAIVQFYFFAVESKKEAHNFRFPNKCNSPARCKTTHISFIIK